VQSLPTLPLLLLLIACLAGALGVYQNLLRRIHSGGGRVRTAEFRGVDVAVCALLAVYFISPAIQNALHKGAPSAGITLRLVLENAASQAGLIVIIGFLLSQHGTGLRHLLGFDRMGHGRAVISGIGLLLAGLPLILGAALLAQLLISNPGSEQGLVTLFRDAAQRSDYTTVGAVLFSAVVLAPASEELVFRGYVYPVLKRYGGGPASAVFTSALFAVAHANLASLPGLFVLALCLTTAYEASGCLMVPAAMHATFNFANLSYLFWQAQSTAP